jgi:hypothetical protein
MLQKTGLELRCEGNVPNCVVKILHGEDYDALVPVFNILFRTVDAQRFGDAKLDKELKKRLIKATYCPYTHFRQHLMV